MKRIAIFLVLLVLMYFATFLLPDLYRGTATNEIRYYGGITLRAPSELFSLKDRKEEFAPNLNIDNLDFHFVPAVLVDETTATMRIMNITGRFFTTFYKPKEGTFSLDTSDSAAFYKVTALDEIMFEWQRSGYGDAELKAFRESGAFERLDEGGKYYYADLAGEEVLVSKQIKQIIWVHEGYLMQVDMPYALFNALVGDKITTERLDEILAVEKVYLD